LDVSTPCKRTFLITFHTLSFGSVDSELVTVIAMSPLTVGWS